MSKYIPVEPITAKDVKTHETISCMFKELYNYRPRHWTHEALADWYNNEFVRIPNEPNRIYSRTQLRDAEWEQKRRKAEQKAKREKQQREREYRELFRYLPFKSLTWDGKNVVQIL